MCASRKGYDLQMGWLRFLAMAVVLQALSSVPGHAQQTGEAARVALVVANGAYPEAAIGNAVPQGRAVADTLRAGGFDVVAVDNAGRTELRQAIAAFTGKLTRGAQAVVFYSGHAIQQRNRNFLLPPQNGAQDAVDLDEIIDPLIVARPASALLFIDASRDNPWQGKGRGLLPLEPMES